MEKVSFILNEKLVCAEYEKGMTLLKYLRNIECMKGTKEACDMGHCGACSVLINGQLARSCVVLMKTLENKSVETIEYQAKDGCLSVIQKSFLDSGAVQCGFCTPGMIMATKALLLRNKAPTDEDIYEGLKNNYCRCTGYVKIIQAVRLAAARLRGEELPLHAVSEGETSSIVIGKDQVVPEIRGSHVGKSVWDVDGPQKVSGSLKYCDDYEAVDLGSDVMLHGAFVWAPAPHARIDSMDMSAAEAAPGVVRVITNRDVPGLKKVGTWTPDQPLFCTDEVRFLGDYLALVVADTEAHARAAAKLARISFTELPGMYSIAEGHKAESYIAQTGRRSGDVDAAKQDPSVTKVRVSKEIEPQDHVCMEPVSAIGVGQQDRVTVYACTQAPFEMRSMLAKNLALPEENVRVVSTPLGGGFGKKCDTYLEGPAAIAGYVCQQPVKITLTRAEDMLITTRRHGYHTDYEIGCTADGKLSYLECSMFSDGGPYEAESYGTLMTGCLMSGGPYIIPNVKVDAWAVRNNNLQGGAFRGYGINQAAISIETALDEMCEKLGMDPFELRRRNALCVGSTTVGGEVLESSMGMHDTIDLCEEHLKKALKKYEGKYPKESKVLGWGVASGFKNCGIGKGIFIDDGACRLTLDPNGHLLMMVSGTDMGQGFRTAMVQIAAETLHMDIKDITIVTGDTQCTIPAGESVSERQTLCDGRAVYEACEKLKEVLRNDPPQVGESRSAEYYFRAPECFPIGNFEEAEKKGVKYRNFPAYAYATQAAIVEVDTKTGEVNVLEIIAAHDVGRAINPRIIEGQIEGSCSMGQGYATTEGHPTKAGYPVKKTYKAMGLPKAKDTPKYDIILIEDPEPLGPYGAKGVSEVATVPITPAILNAISRAIGIRINKVPTSPEVILAALKDGRCDVPSMKEMVNAL